MLPFQSGADEQEIPIWTKEKKGFVLLELAVATGSGGDGMGDCGNAASWKTPIEDHNSTSSD